MIDFSSVIEAFDLQLTYQNQYGNVLKNGVIYDSELEENFRRPFFYDLEADWLPFVEPETYSESVSFEYDELSI